MPAALLAVSVVLLPAQKELLPVMVGVAGGGLAVTVFIADVAEHPLPSVMVTLKLPPALTLIDCVVCPLLHRYPTGEGEEVSVVEFPEQKALAPVMVGVAGSWLTTTLTALTCEQPVVLFVPLI